MKVNLQPGSAEIRGRSAKSKRTAVEELNRNHKRVESRDAEDH
jgi:hypothetical protein